MEGYSLQEAMKLVKEADDVLELEVMFEVQDAPPSPPIAGGAGGGGASPPTFFEVHMQKKTASLNLGITINGSRSRGDPIWISSLKKGGIAYRSGRLRPGDVLLAINGQSLESSNLREAAQVLMGIGESVTLKIAKEYLPASPPAAASSSETIIYSVELHRNQQSLGITLTGSRDQEGHPIVISKIKEDGVAYKTGTLKVGDRILAINGESLYNMTMPQAVCMLNTAGDVVSLKISKAASSRKHHHHKLRHRSGGSPTGRYHHHHNHHHHHHHGNNSSHYNHHHHYNSHHHHHHRQQQQQYGGWSSSNGGGGVSGGSGVGGGGRGIHHRESFGSSSGSSFLGSSSHYQQQHHQYHSQHRMPRSLNYRPKFSTFDPIPLGESASGRNTPDNLSLVSSIPPSSHNPHLHFPFAAAHTPPTMSSSIVDNDSDRFSSVSASNKLSGVMAGSKYHPTLQYVLGQHPQYSIRAGGGGEGGGGGGGGGGRGVVSKQDSSTDDEMSSYEAEGRASSSSVAPMRRPSLPLSYYHHQYSSQQYLPNEGGGEPPTTPGSTPSIGGGGGGGGGVLWDFKSRAGRSHVKLPIPVGRVSPITPGGAEIYSTHSSQQLEEVKGGGTSDDGKAQVGVVFYK